MREIATRTCTRRCKDAPSVVALVTVVVSIMCGPYVALNRLLVVVVLVVVVVAVVVVVSVVVVTTVVVVASKETFLCLFFSYSKVCTWLYDHIRLYYRQRHHMHKAVLQRVRDVW